MSFTNYLKPDLLDTSKLATAASITAASLGATGGAATTTANVFNGLATYVVGARNASNGDSVERALNFLQLAVGEFVHAHL